MVKRQKRFIIFDSLALLLIAIAYWLAPDLIPFNPIDDIIITIILSRFDSISKIM